MGKLHGTLAKAGKVKKQTPKIEKAVKRKDPKGRAYKRILFNRRFVSQIFIFRFANLVVPAAGAQRGGKNKSPNWHAGRKDLMEEEKKKQKQQRDQLKQKSKWSICTTLKTPYNT